MKLAGTGIVAAVAVATLFAYAAAAFAYPNPNATYPDGVARTECADCHGRESDESTLTVAATRKGPHGGYTTGTNKCQTCHSVHAAPAGGTVLLPGATIKATCESCHDGTGGVGVYGAIEARGGVVVASHSVEATTTIPGGDAAGGSSAGMFSGPGGTLTCSDCHSPHDAQTVEPFVGDRLRAEVASDTAYALATNRLLKQQPTSSETTVSVYGAGWCASCHRGRATQHAEDSGLMQTHPVMAVEGVGADEYNYDNLPVVAGEGTTETVLGSLGQSNRGYVMPEGGDGPGSRTELQQGRAPLCQQCHEDARNVGPSERGTNPTVSQDQTFTVSVYSPPPLSEEPTGNPQFAVFPHESNVEYFLVRPVEPAVEDTSTPQNALCLNCHSLLHEVPAGYEGCLVCHDEGDAVDIHAGTVAGCEACHLVGQTLTMDCATCHGANPHDEADHTVTFVPASMDFFTRNHRGSSRTVNVDCAMGCHSNDLVAAHDSDCAKCHPGEWDTFDPVLGCQQSGCHATYHDRVPPPSDYHNVYAIGRPQQDYCDICHSDGRDLPPPADFCLGCHSASVGSTAQSRTLASADSTSPVTVSDVQQSYLGPAYVGFTIMVDGDAVDGSTYYRVNDGRLMMGPGAFVGEPGTHSVEFWSESLSGVTEAPSKSVTFTVVEDTVAPVTTSDALSEYTGPALITLTAIDDGYLGAWYTYYRLNGGPVQFGTTVVVPAPETGTAIYTLEYWSEDWSSNIEAPANMVIFTVASDM